MLTKILAQTKLEIESTKVVLSPFILSKGLPCVVYPFHWCFLLFQPYQPCNTSPGASENLEEEPPSGGDGCHLLPWLVPGLPVRLHSRLSLRRHLPPPLHDRPRLPEAQERKEQGRLSLHRFMRRQKY